MFSESREDVTNKPAGRTSTSKRHKNIDNVKKRVLAKRRITIREVDEDLNISIRSCHSILANDLSISRVAAKFVLKLFNLNRYLCANIRLKTTQ